MQTKQALAHAHTHTHPPTHTRPNASMHTHVIFNLFSYKKFPKMSTSTSFSTLLYFKSPYLMFLGREHREIEHKPQKLFLVSLSSRDFLFVEVMNLVFRIENLNLVHRSVTCHEETDHRLFFYIA